MEQSEKAWGNMTLGSGHRVSQMWTQGTVGRQVYLGACAETIRHTHGCAYNHEESAGGMRN